MKTKIIIGLVSLLAVGTIFHVSTGKCPLGQMIHHGQEPMHQAPAK